MNNGRLDLRTRYGPEISERFVLVLGASELKAMLLVESDCPSCVSPDAGRNRLGYQRGYTLLKPFPEQIEFLFETLAAFSKGLPPL
jgi:hypothetical protein